jgi:hypothetical protein
VKYALQLLARHTVTLWSKNLEPLKKGFHRQYHPVLLQLYANGPHLLVGAYCLLNPGIKQAVLPQVHPLQNFDFTILQVLAKLMKANLLSLGVVFEKFESESRF